MNFRNLNQTIFRILFFFSLFSFCLIQKTISQVNEVKFEELISEGNFEKAVEVGNELLISQPENPKLNFKVGYCYLNQPLKKNRSIAFLEKANDIFKKSDIQTSDAIEAEFYQGMAYHKNYQFDTAIAIFSQMKQKLKNNEILLAIDDEIKQCNTGKLLVQNPVKMQITNLGAAFNSEYADHSPVISADESVLIFTSRRKRFDDEKIEVDGQYNEDIYISNFNGNNWSKPVGISSNINTEGHEASIGLSADGQQLLIYTATDGGTISISTLVGDEWSTPVNAGSNINTRYRETSASMSADGQYIYFTSDRPGGYGGLDIYISEKQKDGSWGKAVNLGPAINTDKDEEGPFIHPDGVTLYFSSKGHETMGGYDIFMSKKNEFGTWALPENMGYPVNTTEDDVFFTMTADGKRAYFASFREGGTGNMDIYMMGLPEAKEIPLTIVKGIVAACKKDINNVQIKVYEVGKDSIVGLYKPNSLTGKYLYILSRGKKYQTIFEIAGKEAFREEFQIGADADFQIVYKQIELKGTGPCYEYVGRENNFPEVAVLDYIDTTENDGFVNVENVMFKVNTADIGYFEDNLIKLLKYLKDNPKLKIEIIGYSDTQGPEAYNLSLSERRAYNVYNFLLSKGAKKEQLSYRGDGVKNQITINNYTDGSYVWQSLPYNRRVEFIVDNDSTGKLKIKQFKIPKVYDLKQGKLTDGDFKEYERTFTIQIGAYSKPIGTDNFPKLKNIQMYFNGKLYYYTIGEFATETLANEELKKINILGYKDAFVRPLSYYFPKNLNKDITQNQ